MEERRTGGGVWGVGGRGRGWARGERHGAGRETGRRVAGREKRGDLSLRVRVGRREGLQLPEKAHEVQEVMLEAVELRELQEEGEVVRVLLQRLLELANARVVERLLTLPGAQRRGAQE